MSSTSTRPAGLALGSAVFAVGFLAELANEVLSLVATRAMLGIVPGRLLADAIPTAILGVGTLSAVFFICQRFSIQSLSIETIGSIAVLCGVLGRYIGAAVGVVFRAGRVPSPTVLVTTADLSLSFTDIGLLVTVFIGLMTAGLWSLVGTFGGIGLVTVSS